MVENRDPPAQHGPSGRSLTLLSNSDRNVGPQRVRRLSGNGLSGCRQDSTESCRGCSVCCSSASRPPSKLPHWYSTSLVTELSAAAPCMVSGCCCHSESVRGVQGLACRNKGGEHALEGLLSLQAADCQVACVGNSKLQGARVVKRAPICAAGAALAYLASHLQGQQ